MAGFPHNNHDGVIHACVLLYVLVFPQSKRISAIKRIVFYYRHVYIFVFFHVFVFSLLLRCMFKVKRIACGSGDLTQCTLTSQ